VSAGDRDDRGILSATDRRRPRTRATTSVLHAMLLVFFLVVGLGPLLWLAKSAITPTQDTLRMPLALFPHGVDLQNLVTAWTKVRIGHYVLNHLVKNLLETSLVVAAGFAFVAYAFERVRRRKPAWRIASVSDIAGLPLFMLLFGAYQFVATPINNSIIRVTEYEADIFGLNAAQQPDGFANAALKLGDYRKLRPGPLEELIFFDHPSGHTRIYSAMRWKRELTHPNLR